MHPESIFDSRWAPGFPTRHLPQLPLDNAHLIAGVELLTDNKLGTDGTYRGVRYFKSSPKRGYFFKLKDCKAVKH